MEEPFVGENGGGEVGSAEERELGVAWSEDVSKKSGREMGREGTGRNGMEGLPLVMLSSSQLFSSLSALWRMSE